MFDDTNPAVRTDAVPRSGGGGPERRGNSRYLVPVVAAGGGFVAGCLTMAITDTALLKLEAPSDEGVSTAVVSSNIPTCEAGVTLAPEILVTIVTATPGEVAEPPETDTPTPLPPEDPFVSFIESLTELGLDYDLTTGYFVDSEGKLFHVDMKLIERDERSEGYCPEKIKIGIVLKEVNPVCTVPSTQPALLPTVPVWTPTGEIVETPPTSEPPKTPTPGQPTPPIATPVPTNSDNIPTATPGS